MMNSIEMYFVKLGILKHSILIKSIQLVTNETQEIIKYDKYLHSFQMIHTTNKKKD